MNQHASDAPQHEGDPHSSGEDLSADLESRDLGGDVADSNLGKTNDATEVPSAINAELIDSGGESVIRVGSPFAVDPFAPDRIKTIEPFYDVGPIRYTAMGAVAASIMVVGFALAAALWFPAGGALIAALGCVLSIFGLYSAFRITSSGLLAVHLSLFVLSYIRSLG